MTINKHLQVIDQSSATHIRCQLILAFDDDSNQGKPWSWPLEKFAKEKCQMSWFTFQFFHQPAECALCSPISSVCICFVSQCFHFWELYQQCPGQIWIFSVKTSSLNFGLTVEIAQSGWIGQIAFHRMSTFYLLPD